MGNSGSHEHGKHSSSTHGRHHRQSAESQRNEMVLREHLDRLTISSGESGFSLHREAELRTHLDESLLLVPDDTSRPIPISRVPSGREVDLVEDDGGFVELSGPTVVPTKIVWTQGGERVYVTGSFVDWKYMFPLVKDTESGTFTGIVNVPAGAHKIEFVVDGCLKLSNDLPTATDSVGNFVNYLETDKPMADDEQPESLEIATPEPIPPPEYVTEIPVIFTGETEKVPAESYQAPPTLPPHLETAIVNGGRVTKDDSSVLPIPNHVVLNHLATTSIKHGTLAVASTSRYSRKFVTQILYAPL
ncbi:SNF1 protein kinase subunit beta-2 [Trichomonascus vanleenenianus]|uniref:protein kinase subunit beta n=1 Tax=Trichomonascus vanleenenianus TaxID=2268995 RepID=UPI003ECA687F